MADTPRGVDAVRLRYAEALSRRLPAQPEPVRRILEEKLRAALAEVAAAGDATRPPPTPARSEAARSPLQELNERIRHAREQRLGPAAPGERRDAEELASARRFRQAWERSRMLDQVQQAVARKPANAGPLNSHALVLKTLDLLRDLSPEYLARFVEQVETLQWLEAAREHAAPAPGRDGKPAKAVRRARRSK